ncbi:hypothetical protein HMPREF1557_01712 [Streptococcus sobrinus W1703]|uniref:Uncharacterized protein n=1 Tax=Streptococcus sobrinus W1703 TaxID=1227275 RepID=U2IK83_9STRE|nr:hypothetical protein HMPREF1557_01712 [Streptococcus sobrinus W1703]
MSKSVIEIETEIGRTKSHQLLSQSHLLGFEAAGLNQKYLV